MKIFISWSKDVSHSYAVAFRDWLPNVIQSSEPFISSQDIGLGQRGIEEIENRLSNLSFGILFVTNENRNEPWLLYEAGALSRTIDQAESRVIPILIDVGRAQLSGSPLSHFQNAQSMSKETFRKLCSTVNEATNDPMDSDRLKQSFEKWWPDLEAEFAKIEQPNVVKQLVTLESLAESISEIGKAIVELRNNERRQSELLLRQIDAGSVGVGSANGVRPLFSSFSEKEASLSPENAHMRVKNTFGNIGAEALKAAIETQLVQMRQDSQILGQTGGHSDTTD